MGQNAGAIDPRRAETYERHDLCNLHLHRFANSMPTLADAGVLSISKGLHQLHDQSVWTWLDNGRNTEKWAPVSLFKWRPGNVDGMRGAPRLYLATRAVASNSDSSSFRCARFTVASLTL